MRTIKIERKYKYEGARCHIVFITDWNFKQWTLQADSNWEYFLNAPGFMACTFKNDREFITKMYGDEQIGDFVNYEVEII